MNNPRIATIIDESLRIIKSTPALLIALGGGVIPFFGYLSDITQTLQLALISGLLILVLFLIALTWNLSKYAQTTYWSDRRYKLMTTRWEYKPNNDFETLHAQQRGARKIECLSSSLSHVTISISPEENLTPFREEDRNEAIITKFTREQGSVSARSPHRNADASFSFRIEFYPPLHQGEEVYFEYLVILPRFRISTIETLRARCQVAKLDARDYEYSSWSSRYKIEHLIYEHHFHSSCKIEPLDIEVLRGNTPFSEEYDSVTKSGAFKCEKSTNGWTIRLDRKSPPISARYKIKWRPPTKEALARPE